MRNVHYFKIICCCLLYISTSLFSNEDIQNCYGKWYTDELKSLPNTVTSKITNVPKVITPEDLKNLKEYIKDTNFSGVVYLSDETATYKICSEKFETMKDDELIFPIHSIGKVYTGILTLIMVLEGIIKDEALLAPLEVDISVMKSLPLSVQNQMKVATLYDTMIHKGGFGNYLGKYIKFIQKSLEDKNPPKTLHKPEDFLPFSDEEIFKLEPNASHYSNLGILLLGLSIQHHYQKVYPLDYNAILKKHILDKAEISSFFNSKPEHGHFNENDPVAEYLCASPAGGYWTTVKDLHKFGEWIRKKCAKEPNFMHLIEKYGQEFYSETKREISHEGGISSASAFFSVLLDNGFTIVIESDNNILRSRFLYNAIVRNILAL